MGSLRKYRDSVLDKVPNFVKDISRSRELQLVTILLIIIFFIFYINTFHETYPDEFDNILGGKLILDGVFPYTGFFSHHGPVTYFISAIIHIFSGDSFVKFRVFYSAFLFLYSLAIYLFFRMRFGEERARPVLILIGIIALSGVYMWSHMLLADNLAAFFLTPVLAMIFLTRIYRQKLLITDVIFLSLLTGLGVLSSLAFSYLSIFIYLYILFLYVSEYKFSFFTKRFVIFGCILIAPYIIFILYLMLTGSVGQYYEQAVAFNQKYYIYNYPRPEGSTSTFINPIRYAIVITYNFFNNFTSLLMQLKDFNLQFPLNITLALGNTVLLIYFLLKKKWDLAVFLLMILIFSNSRSNPLESKETDYQSAVYMMFSFFAICLVLPRLYFEANTSLNSAKKFTYLILFILLCLYTSFSVIFLTKKFSEKAYAKYMGFAPRIYDRSEVAPIMNLINGKEYSWTGPFEYEEMLYMNGKLPTKYHVLLPGVGRSPRMQQEMLSEISTNKPKAIWFDKNFFILGYKSGDYGKFFTDFLSENYTTLYELRDTGVVYSSVAPISERRDIETMLYIRKDKLQEVIDKLLQDNRIKEEANSYGIS